METQNLHSKPNLPSPGNAFIADFIGESSLLSATVKMVSQALVLKTKGNQKLGKDRDFFGDPT